MTIPISAIASPLSAPSTAPSSMARRADAVGGRTERQPARQGVADTASAQQARADNTAEDAHEEDHYRGDAHYSAERFADGHGDRHGDRFGGDGVQNRAVGAQCAGDIDDAQHPDRTADADRSQNGKHLPAQAVGLFVHQVSQRDDRHAQQEVENFGGLTIVAVVDAADFQKEYQRDERQQRRVEDRQAEAMVQRHAAAVESYGEREQEHVGVDEGADHGLRPIFWNVHPTLSRTSSVLTMLATAIAHRCRAIRS